MKSAFFVLLVLALGTNVTAKSDVKPTHLKVPDKNGHLTWKCSSPANDLKAEVTSSTLSDVLDFGIVVTTHTDDPNIVFSEAHLSVWNTLGHRDGSPSFKKSFTMNEPPLCTKHTCAVLLPGVHIAAPSTAPSRVGYGLALYYINGTQEATIKAHCN